MELKLTNEQIKLIENRLKENFKKEKELRIKDRKIKPVDRWGVIELLNERCDLEHIIKNGYVEL